MVQILISNYNSWEAIQLCIESVRTFTDGQYEVIVYDDGSTNRTDLEYLKSVKWITLISDPVNHSHGHSLNSLLEACASDLAIVLDNDIQILKRGWCQAIKFLLKDDKVLIACGMEHIDHSGERPSYPYWFQSWIMGINMKAYRDGMQVDWRHRTHNDLYYPVGARLHQKIQHQNPMGYKHALLPESFNQYYKHYAHISCIATPDQSDTQEFIAVRDSRMSEIRKELKRLRSGKISRDSNL